MSNDDALVEVIPRKKVRSAKRRHTERLPPGSRDGRDRAQQAIAFEPATESARVGRCVFSQKTQTVRSAE